MILFVCEYFTGGGLIGKDLSSNFIREGEMIINPHQEGAGSALDSVSSGINVSLTTLDKLIHQYDIPDNSVLKIDCEGCEVDVILSSNKETLQKFTHIEIEYHSQRPIVQ